MDFRTLLARAGVPTVAGVLALTSLATPAALARPAPPGGAGGGGTNSAGTQYCLDVQLTRGSVNATGQAWETAIEVTVQNNCGASLGAGSYTVSADATCESPADGPVYSVPGTEFGRILPLTPAQKPRLIFDRSLTSYCVTLDPVLGIPDRQFPPKEVEVSVQVQAPFADSAQTAWGYAAMTVTGP